MDDRAPSASPPTPSPNEDGPKHNYENWDATRPAGTWRPMVSPGETFRTAMLAVLREARDGGRDAEAGKASTPDARGYAEYHGLVRQNGSGPKLTGAGLMLLASLERGE